MKFITTLLIPLLLLIACGSTPPEPTEPAIAETLVLPTDTPSAAVDSATEVPTEATEAAAPPTVVPTEAPPTPTPEPPTPTPEPPTPTPEPTVPSEVVIEAEGAILPTGFSMLKYADTRRPVAFNFDDEGYLWSTHQSGEIFVHKDTTGDGRADFVQQYSFGFDWPNGIAIHPENGDVYISQKGKITRTRDVDGDFTMDEIEPFVQGLPFGLHWSNNLVFGPDGWLYMGLGSTCDVCVEADERSATVMRFDTTTGEGEIVATGLRNPFDVAFHPETGALFATDNGRDDLGPGEPLEELNHVISGFDYGWPDCWGDLQGDGCAGTQRAIGFFQAHSSTNSLEFYTANQFPAEYQGTLFASVFGSWFFPGEVKQGIRQITVTPNGGTYDAASTWFMQWDAFLLGLAVGPDGALYVGDYNVAEPDNGAIYRISYGLP